MRDKKLRGIKRKTKNMVKNIEEHTVEFPLDFHNGYWHMHLPVAQDFIDSATTPNKIKRFCIQTLVERANHLINLKPNNKDIYRVVVAVNFPELWSSQIIVFKNEDYFSGFFDRYNIYQTWLHLPEERSIQREWGLTIPSNMQILGFKELINDEDYSYEGEIWFIGELE
ncbi:DUF3916 domain-containing protein [Priestia filamentosa]|uniref:DUF3916 domain-containing protein n=1 Tax=Priestia filamentosa TaxID=1402861 RepID=UPI00398295CC